MHGAHPQLARTDATVQAAHSCTASARYDAALAAARLVDKLVAVAGSATAPEGGRELAQLLACADVRAAPRARTMRMGRPRQIPSGRETMDGQSADGSGSLQLPLLFLKAGPADGRLRRPSSAGNPHLPQPGAPSPQDPSPSA
jgi:hypothetical protein